MMVITSLTFFLKSKVVFDDSFWKALFEPYWLKQWSQYRKAIDQCSLKQQKISLDAKKLLSRSFVQKFV